MARHKGQAQGRELRPRRFCGGQATIEYIVVLSFGVMVLLKPFSNPDTPGQPEESVLKQVARAIKDYHKHYTYAMAIAQIPDCDYTYTTSADKWTSTDITSYLPPSFASLNPTVSLSVDRCIDWSKPELPKPTVTLSGFPDLGSSLTGAIEQYVKDSVKQAVEGLLKPENIAGAIGMPTGLPF